MMSDLFTSETIRTARSLFAQTKNQYVCDFRYLFVNQSISTKCYATVADILWLRRCKTIIMAD